MHGEYNKYVILKKNKENTSCKTRKTLYISMRTLINMLMKLFLNKVVSIYGSR